MSSRTLAPAEQAKKQRIQLAVASLLAAVLVAVLMFPSSPNGGQDKPSPTAAGVAAGPAIGQPATDAAPTPDASRYVRPLAELPELELEKVIAANPFVSARRLSLAEQGIGALSVAGGQAPGVSTVEREARAVRQVAVQAIIHDAAQPTVLIDGQIAGLHDTINGHWRIVEVLPQSVRVEYVGE
ncbi:hypothetical protein Pla123a_29350 [Posidoniimonas polymericola]|uniref:Uncharacterized protein n=1 Tax=Posidoniimonas polymericola TaxID=2528002 RepID=A0A5C5YMQ1_9BACT|nr:hypothetical protein [Posidoniimonas polymericola]TWT76146.1 hypothetical protein Pla123a_29350 [Posidoniimonas polymericola]